MSLLIRPREDRDIEAICAISRALFPEQPSDPDVVREGDAQADPSLVHERWTALRDGMVVGAASLEHSEWAYDPHRFVVSAVVPRDRQGEGIGRALWQTLRGRAAELGAQALRTNYREDSPRSERFLRERGFEELCRRWESWLDLAAFDAGLLAAKAAAAEAAGIRIVPLTALLHTSGWERRMYDLDRECTLQMPAPEPLTLRSFDRWIASIKSSSTFLWDCYFVAIDERSGEWVGASNAETHPGSGILTTGFTGVRAAYRGRGIATALKLRVARYGCERGYARISTMNDSTNRAMLAINEGMGFVKRRPWVEMVLRLPEPRAH
jgi:GNAT superfamily N-acetyltransferase